MGRQARRIFYTSSPVAVVSRGRRDGGSRSRGWPPPSQEPSHGNGPAATKPTTSRTSKKTRRRGSQGKAGDLCNRGSFAAEPEPGRHPCSETPEAVGQKRSETKKLTRRRNRPAERGTAETDGTETAADQGNATAPFAGGFGRHRYGNGRKNISGERSAGQPHHVHPPSGFFLKF